MDLLVLIDTLDDLVHNAKPVPLTDQVRVDKGQISDLLDQMRAAVPELAASGPRADQVGVDRQALTDAVSAAIRESIPEIARATAAAVASRPPTPPGPPPGGPF